MAQDPIGECVKLPVCPGERHKGGFAWFVLAVNIWPHKRVFGFVEAQPAWEETFDNFLEDFSGQGGEGHRYWWP
jgi:hypothetical protein